MPTGQYKRKPKDPRIELSKRFVIDSKTGCWLWTGNKQTQGYGTIQVNNVLWLAHRLAWTIFVGPIPEGIFVLHDCPLGDNPGCINPNHMFLGTQLDNMRDAEAKSRMKRVEWTLERRKRRGLAAKDWWSKATAAQKAKIHIAQRDIDGKFIKGISDESSYT